MDILKHKSSKRDEHSKYGEPNQHNKLIQNDEPKYDKLHNASKSTPKFTLDGQVYRAKCVSVYDADTVNAVFLFHGELTRWAIRIYGVNSPEIRSGTPETIMAGMRARDWVREQILDKIVYVKCYGFGKYGRLIADIYLDSTCSNQTLSSMLLENGMAVPYMRT